MRIKSLKMIEASDRLIIHQLENVSIPSLQGKIDGMVKKDSIQNVNTKLEIGSLQGDVKKQSSQKKWWGLSGFIAGMLTTILAILLL